MAVTLRPDVAVVAAALRRDFVDFIPAVAESDIETRIAALDKGIPSDVRSAISDAGFVLFVRTSSQSLASLVERISKTYRVVAGPMPGPAWTAACLLPPVFINSIDGIRTFGLIIAARD